MLILLCTAERCENYLHIGESLCLSISDHNTDNKIKYYIACVFVSSMFQARNSSSFKSFSETREKFWKWLRVRGYPFSFLLPLFREIQYSDRRRWLAPKSTHGIGGNKTIVFKTTFNCSHARTCSDHKHPQPGIECRCPCLGSSKGD